MRRAARPVGGGTVGAPDSSPTRSLLLVDADEAARRLYISTRKLWDLTSRGEIACVRLGRAVRYSVEYLARWAVERSIESQSSDRTLAAAPDIAKSPKGAPGDAAPDSNRDGSGGATPTAAARLKWPRR